MCVWSLHAERAAALEPTGCRNAGRGQPYFKGNRSRQNGEVGPYSRVDAGASLPEQGDEEDNDIHGDMDMLVHVSEVGRRPSGKGSLSEKGRARFWGGGGERPFPCCTGLGGCCLLTKNTAFTIAVQLRD
jgi:hypothetical protein